MDPKLQESIINLLVIVISIFGAALTTWWRQQQTKKDVDAIADKQRATDKEVGIETRWDPKTRSVNVTRVGSQTRSGSPELLGGEGERKASQEARPLG